MTDKLKEELKVNIQKLTDLLYNEMVKAMEAAEKTFPTDADEELRSKIMQQTIEDSFKAQQAAIVQGFEDVQSKLNDKDYVNKVREDLNDRGS